MTTPETYEYQSGPSVFMSGESDWVIRRVGKPGIVASVIGHESHAQQAVEALNQAALVDFNRYTYLKAYADQLAAALHIAIYGMHPAYGNSAGWRGGVGGATITHGCSFIDAPPKDEHVSGRLSEVLSDYIQRYGPDAGEARKKLLAPPEGPE